MEGQKINFFFHHFQTTSWKHLLVWIETCLFLKVENLKRFHRNRISQTTWFLVTLCKDWQIRQIPTTLLVLSITSYMQTFERFLLCAAESWSDWKPQIWRLVRRHCSSSGLCLFDQILIVFLIVIASPNDLISTCWIDLFFYHNSSLSFFFQVKLSFHYTTGRP